MNNKVSGIIKRKVSIFTVILWVFLIVSMTIIIANSFIKSNALTEENNVEDIVINSISGEEEDGYFRTSFSRGYSPAYTNKTEKRIEFEDIIYTNFYLKNYDVNRGCKVKLYLIFTKGQSILSTKEEMINSIIASIPNVKLNNGDEFVGDGLRDYIREHTRIDIDYNYRNSDRTKISVIFDLNEIDWSYYLTNTLENGNISIRIKSELTYENIQEYGNNSKKSARLDTLNGYFLMWDNQEYDYGSSNNASQGSPDDILNNDPIFSDLDEDGDITERRTSEISTGSRYASTESEKSIVQQLQTDLTRGKFVLDTADVTIGSNYEYKLKITAGENSIKDLIIYKTLEENDGWKGKFLDVNTDYAVSKGYSPIVYYSEELNPTKITEDETKWKVLTDTVDKTTVKSICVDLRYNANGTNMQLDPYNVVYVKINMKAPYDDSIPTTTSSDFIANLNETGNVEELIANKINLNLSKENAIKSISGKISWIDENNKYEMRPDNAIVKLLQDGVEYGSVTTDKSKKWEYTFSDLPMYSSVGEYNYEIVEEKVNGYITSYLDYDITNEIELIELTVIKAWNDNNNEAGKRPTSVTLQVKSNDTVLAEQVVKEANNFRCEFELAKYDRLGNEIEYTIDEKDTGSKFYTKEKIEKTSDIETTITNKFEVPDEKVNIEVTNLWEDNNNESQKRPASIILQVFDGNKLITEAEVTEKDEWKYMFELAKYDSLGNEIEYTVNEKSFSNDKFYTKEIVGNTITNRFTVPEDKITITGIKVWNDNNNEAGKRPTSITLQVKANGTVVAEQVVNESNNFRYDFELAKYDRLGNEIEYTIDEKDSGNKFYVKEKVEKTVDNNFTVINKFEVPDEKVNIEVTNLWEDNNNESKKRPVSIILQVFDGNKLITEAEVTEKDEWKYMFELAKYDSLGNEIEYTVNEKSFSNDKFYTKEIVGNTITNRFTVPEDKITITGIKTWNDNNNEAGKRPTSITLQVKANNKVVVEQVVNESNNFRYDFELAKYDRLGNEIEYTIDEKDTGSKFYTKEKIEKTSDTETTITNKFEVPDEKVNVEVIKIWDDNNNESGKRPENVTLQVKDGERVVASHIVSEEDEWKYTFELPKYDSLGDEITYTVDEEYTNKFYIKEIVGNIITNRFVVPEDKIKLVGTKVWEDNEDFAKKRPENVTLQVIANNEIITEHEVSEVNNWSYEFELAKYDRYGNEIEYHIDERDVGSKFYEKELTNTTTVINKFKVPDEKINLEVMKTWDDNNNEAGKRPDSITLQVKENAVVVAEQVVSDENNWRYTFELPKYNETGDEVEYTVDEKELDGEVSKFYVKNIVGNVITNKFVVPEDRVKIVGTKVWNDNGNAGGKRDTSVILQLKVGDNIISEAEVNDSNNWSYEFEVPKYDELGNEIEYYIDERNSDNKFYKKMLTNKNTVTNEFVVPEEVVLINAVKKWEDNNDEYGKRLESVILQVYDGDKLVAEEKVSAENNWSYEFELPKYDELGDEIEYTVDEKSISKYYEKSVEGNIVINKCIYEPLVDTSDMNIFVYIVIFFVTIISIIIEIKYFNNKKINGVNNFKN